MIGNLAYQGNGPTLLGAFADSAFSAASSHASRRISSIPSGEFPQLSSPSMRAWRSALVRVSIFAWRPDGSPLRMSCNDLMSGARPSPRSDAWHPCAHAARAQSGRRLPFVEQSPPTLPDGLRGCRCAYDEDKCLVPRHLGNVGQPQNRCPALVPRLAVRKTMSVPH